MAHAAPTRKMTLWERITTFEPALLRAVLAALGIVLLTVGIDASDVFTKVDTAWTALFAIFPLIQGWLTRSVVVPQNAVVEQVTPEGLVLAGPASPVETGTVLRHVDDNATME